MCDGGDGNNEIEVTSKEKMSYTSPNVRSPYQPSAEDVSDEETSLDYLIGLCSPNVQDIVDDFFGVGDGSGGNVDDADAGGADFGSGGVDYADVNIDNADNADVSSGGVDYADVGVDNAGNADVSSGDVDCTDGVGDDIGSADVSSSYLFCTNSSEGDYIDSNGVDVSTNDVNGTNVGTSYVSGDNHTVGVHGAGEAENSDNVDELSDCISLSSESDEEEVCFNKMNLTFTKTETIRSGKVVSVSRSATIGYSNNISANDIKHTLKDMFQYVHNEFAEYAKYCNDKM